MIGELIQSAYTYNQGRIAINNAFSGEASLNGFSANTMFSGQTNLYDIFLTTTDGNDITRVQSGTNISTGGTANEPIINLDNNISVISISADTIFSGNTNLYDIFATTVENKGFVTLTSPTSAFTWDYSSYNNANLILNGKSTLSIININNGDEGKLKVYMSTEVTTNERVLYLPLNKFIENNSIKEIDGNQEILLSQTGTAVDILSFIYDNEDFFWKSRLNYNI